MEDRRQLWHTRNTRGLLYMNNYIDNNDKKQLAGKQGFNDKPQRDAFKRMASYGGCEVTRNYLVDYFKLDMTNEEYYISSDPLGNNKVEDYKLQSTNLIIDSFKQNHNIKKQINVYKHYCECIYQKKINKNKISGYDLQTFSACCLALVKLKVFDEDDVIFIAPRRKKRGKRFIQFI